MTARVQSAARERGEAVCGQQRADTACASPSRAGGRRGCVRASHHSGVCLWDVGESSRCCLHLISSVSMHINAATPSANAPPSLTHTRAHINKHNKHALQIIHAAGQLTAAAASATTEPLPPLELFYARPSSSGPCLLQALGSAAAQVGVLTHV